VLILHYYVTYGAQMSKPEGFRAPRVQANPDNKFRDYLPGQVEHCLRLTLERLQLGLKKDSGIIDNREVAELARAAADLYSIYCDL